LAAGPIEGILFAEMFLVMFRPSDGLNITGKIPFQDCLLIVTAV